MFDFDPAKLLALKRMGDSWEALMTTGAVDGRGRGDEMDSASSS